MRMTDQPRTRTITWEDPMVGAAAARTMSGLEYLQAMERGELPLPPIMATMGITGVHAGDGCVVVSLEPQEYHYNPIGVVHGGVASTLCDTATACAHATSTCLIMRGRGG